MDRRGAYTDDDYERRRRRRDDRDFGRKLSTRSDDRGHKGSSSRDGGRRRQERDWDPELEKPRHR
jgi:hypothetical protein